MNGASLELGRTDQAERGMAAPLVIEHLDVIEQDLLRVSVTLEALRLLALHGGEPALDHRVVIAIAATTHGTGDAVLVEPRAVVLARVGAALIRVMEQAGIWT